MLAAAADRTHHHIDVVVQAIEVDEQHRAHRAIGLEFAGSARGNSRRTASHGRRTHPGGSSRQQRAGPEAGEHELASIHGVALSGHAQDGREVRIEEPPAGIQRLAHLGECLPARIEPLQLVR